MKRYGDLYDYMTCFENLYESYLRAAKGRDLRHEVLEFTLHLEENLMTLHEELQDMTYRRGIMRSFYVYDPVKRLIMAAPFRDRVVDWAIYSVLNPLVDKRYISTSYGCRIGRGPQAAMKKLQEYSAVSPVRPSSARWTSPSISIVWITKFSWRGGQGQ